ncbi:hypothetical protein ACOME3_005101 [Neoechinorhynchus agilis]
MEAQKCSTEDYSPEMDKQTINVSNNKEFDTIDGMSCTHMPVNNFTHLWVIDNFRSFVEDPEYVVHLKTPIISPPEAFSTSSLSSIKLRIHCYPKGVFGLLTDRMYVRLDYESGTENIRMRVRFYIVMDNAKGRAEYEISSGEVYNVYTPDDDCQISQRPYGCAEIHHDLIFNTLELDDRISILARISIMDKHITVPVDIEGLPKICESKLISDMAKILKSGEASDVEIVVYGDDQEKKEVIKAHRVVLAARCPTLKQLLTQRDATGDFPKRVKTTGFLPATIKSILDYLYTESVPYEGDLIDIFCAAHHYKLNDLVSILERKLTSVVRPDNAAEMLFHANELNAKQLVQYTVKYIVYHTEDVTQTEGFKKYILSNQELLTQVIKYAGLLVHRK